MRLTDLVHRLNEYLAIHEVEDFSPQGLQVEGRADVRRVVTSVTASARLFEEAARRGADAVLVHHGMFFRKDDPVIKGALKRRIKTLLDHDLSLLTYHLPLDRHPEVGNNAVAARRLGLEDIEPWGRYGSTTIGYSGRYAEPLSVAEFVARVDALYEGSTHGRAPLVFEAEHGTVQRVGIISGGAEDYFRQAVADGLDCFVTGEAREWVMHHAEEARVTYVAAGHYATERVGILALGEWMARELGVHVEFVEMPNPV